VKAKTIVFSYCIMIKISFVFELVNCFVVLMIRFNK